MFKKNTAVTGFAIGHFINATTGAAVTTGTPGCKRILDGTGAACANAAAYNSDAGQWEIDLDAADTNGDMVGLAFTLTDCVPISYRFRTVTGIPDASGHYPADVIEAAGTAWASGAITAAALAADCITAAKIADDAIASEHLATGAITADAIADNAIDAGAIAAGAITDAKINTGAITAAKFAAGAIDAAAIANSAIDAATFAADVDAEFLGYLVDDATRIDASALNTASGTSIPAILADTGTDGVVVATASKTGYSLTATTGLGNQTADITGSLSGSVGSVAANGITATSIAADAINAAAVKADAVTKIQNGLATPTNITAGTITTVTNLTNAPTSGDLTATMKASVTAAVPTTAQIKTALEVDGGKLDHLWEMTEDDGGVRRLTANALEEAPGGGSGGDATEANQTTIITHLTDIKGTGFVKDTHSLVNLTGSAPVDVTVTGTSVQVTDA
jgi:hypothetical protein